MLAIPYLWHHCMLSVQGTDNLFPKFIGLQTEKNCTHGAVLRELCMRTWT